MQIKHSKVASTQVSSSEDLIRAADWNAEHIVTGLAISDVDGLQPALDEKALTGHGHEISDVSGLQNALDGKAAAEHGHEIDDVTGLQDALDGKADNGHGHAIDDVTGLQPALDGKALTGHGHEISDVSGLQPALDGKAAAEHGHSTLTVRVNTGATEGTDQFTYNGTGPTSVNLLAGTNITLETSTPGDVTVNATGGVVESGWNINGDYIRFDDGTQICWGQVSATVAIETAFADGFRSENDAMQFQFPAVFDSVVNVTLTRLEMLSGASEMSVAISNSYTWESQFGIIVKAVTSQPAATRQFRYVAIGRWYYPD